MASHISQCSPSNQCGTKRRIPGADLKYWLFVFESNNRPEIISIFVLFRKWKSALVQTAHHMPISIRCNSLAKSTNILSHINTSHVANRFKWFAHRIFLSIDSVSLTSVKIQCIRLQTFSTMNPHNVSFCSVDHTTITDNMDTK